MSIRFALRRHVCVSGSGQIPDLYATRRYIAVLPEMRHWTVLRQMYHVHAFAFCTLINFNIILSSTLGAGLAQAV
jgi:hypothetical protein